MGWTEGIQAALDYIEAHLSEELDYGAIASQAACSPFYFQRIFGVLCGMTLGEYIRFRRLSLAGSEVMCGGKVIDIALKYGYESPESFTRAFTRFHGITPTEARQHKAPLKSVSRLQVNISLKGGTTMNYRIEEEPAFTVLEYAERQSVEHEKQTIPALWERVIRDGTLAKLRQYASDPTVEFGICWDAYYNETDYDYGIAVKCAPDLQAPEGFRVREVPASLWLKADCPGSTAEPIQKLWHELVTEFFPTAQYRPTGTVDLEVYPVYEGSDAEDHACEIWFSVTKA